MGDAHGNVVHFHERECSIQRRNQKVLEEAPSPGIGDEVRTKLHEGALALARHVGYQNAGTVEFLVGDDGTITFLEVNTRLQVEHRVTEIVCGGIDLVELQLRVAAGEPLPMTQDEIHVSGHAIAGATRRRGPGRGVAAVDRDRPRVRRVGVAVHSDVEAAVAAGSVVSADYDSLLMNVVAVGPRSTRLPRPGCSRSLADARDRRRPHRTWRRWSAILREPDFLAGRHHHGVPRRASRRADGRGAVRRRRDRAPARRRVRRRAAQHGSATAPRASRRRAGGTCARRASDGRGRSTARCTRSSTWWRATARACWWARRRSRRPTARCRPTIVVASRSGSSSATTTGRCSRSTACGVRSRCRSPATRRSPRRTGCRSAWVRPPRFADHDADQAGSGPVSPLPGTVIAVHVEAGQTVADGTLLMVVEAMKMEHKIVAHTDADGGRGALRRRRPRRRRRPPGRAGGPGMNRRTNERGAVTCCGSV